MSTATEIRFNINGMVRFRLTRAGERAIAEYWKCDDLPGCPAYDWFAHHKPDADGYYRDQLWHLMHMFGPSLGVGSRPLVEGNDLLIPSEGDGWEGT